MSAQLPRNEDGSLMSYAWPGGYTIYYVCKDGSVLCPACANKQEMKNLRTAAQTAYDAIYAEYEDTVLFGLEPVGKLRRYWNGVLESELIIGADVNYEDCDLYCEDCSKRIDPSYLTDEDCQCKE